MPSDGTRYCTLRQTLLLRADGGFGGPPPAPAPSLIPDREADGRAIAQVSLRAALIYRLSGDRNPLHADPEAAKRAGFDRPILHGLASYAMAGVAVARACGHPPDARQRAAVPLLRRGVSRRFPRLQDLERGKSSDVSGLRRRAKSARSRTRFVRGRQMKGDLGSGGRLRGKTRSNRGRKSRYRRA